MVLRQVSFQDGIRIPPIVKKTPSGRIRVEGGSGREARVRTDEQGVAVFETVPTQGVFRALLEEDGDLDPVAPVDLPAGVDGAVLREGTGAALQIDLAWQDGAPASRVGMLVRCPETRFMCRLSSDDEGRLRLGGLSPNVYTLSADTGFTTQIRLTAGERREETIVLE